MNKIIVLIIASTFSLAACGGFFGSKVVEDNTNSPNKDFDSVNGSIKVGHHANVGDLSTVNGSVKVASDSQVGETSTVNGKVTFEESVTAKNAETVNGTINLGANCKIEEGVESVNGKILLNAGCEIGGNLETVNGKLRAMDTEIHGNVETVNGNIFLLENTIVHEDIIIRKNKSFFSSPKPGKYKVVLGKNVVIKGDLEFGKHIDLYVHESAELNTDFDDIKNATIHSFSGDETPYK